MTAPIAAETSYQTLIFELQKPKLPPGKTSLRRMSQAPAVGRPVVGGPPVVGGGRGPPAAGGRGPPAAMPPINSALDEATADYLQGLRSAVRPQKVPAICRCSCQRPLIAMGYASNAGVLQQHEVHCISKRLSGLRWIGVVAGKECVGSHHSLSHAGVVLSSDCYILSRSSVWLAASHAAYISKLTAISTAQASAAPKQQAQADKVRAGARGEGPETPPQDESHPAAPAVRERSYIGCAWSHIAVSSQEALITRDMPACVLPSLVANICPGWQHHQLASPATECMQLP